MTTNMTTFEIRGLSLFIDGKDFAKEVFKLLEPVEGTVPQGAKWARFNPSINGKEVSKKIEGTVEYIFDLRQQSKDDAIYLSDAFFQSFTPTMNILWQEGRISDMTDLWLWVLSIVRIIEEKEKIEEGKGVHKGTAFFFLAISRLLAKDVDGAFIQFAEAAKEDEYLPPSVLSNHKKGIPPAVKVLLLDLSKDNFAYPVCKDIRDMIIKWEKDYPDISRNKSVFDSIEDAIKRKVILLESLESVTSFSYVLMKSCIFESWRQAKIRPTAQAIERAGDCLFLLARGVEDLIRESKSLGRNVSVFNFVHNNYFISEHWSSITSYDSNTKQLVTDFLSKTWGISKDGSNLVFNFKLRNQALAHKRPSDPILLEHFPLLIIALISAYAYVCENIL